MNISKLFKVSRLFMQETLNGLFCCTLITMGRDSAVMKHEDKNMALIYSI